MWNKFLFVCFVPIIIFLICMGIFNFSVDPYDLRNACGVEKFNKSKIFSADRERSLKPLTYLREKPEAVVLGDSKSGFSIVTEDLNKILNVKNTFNLSLRNATPFEIYETLKFAKEKNTNLKKVIISLDFEMMGQFEKQKNGFSTSLLNYGFLPFEDRCASLFSVTSFADSIETIRINREKNLPVIYNKNGEISEEHLVNFFKKEGDFNRNSCAIFTNFKAVENSQKYQKFYLDAFNRDMISLQNIKSFLTENNVDYYILILPLHDNELSAVNNKFYFAWKSQIKRIFPEIIDLSLALNSDKNLYYDGAHPKKKPTMELLSNFFNNQKIPYREFKFNDDFVFPTNFFGEVKLNDSFKTKYIDIDKKLLKLGVVHLTADADIESENAYFLIESENNKNEKFLVKATRYGEAKTQTLLSLITQNRENFPLDGRSAADNLGRGDYNVYLGKITENVFITDGVKALFSIE